MIENIRHRGLKRFYENNDQRYLPPAMVERLRVILSVLDQAKEIGDMNRPSFRLHPLKGELKGFWSVTVRANWRIIFKFEGENVTDVDFVDYH